MGVRCMVLEAGAATAVGGHHMIQRYVDEALVASGVFEMILFPGYGWVSGHVFIQNLELCAN